MRFISTFPIATAPGALYLILVALTQSFTTSAAPIPDSNRIAGTALLGVAAIGSGSAVAYGLVGENRRQGRLTRARLDDVGRRVVAGLNGCVDCYDNKERPHRGEEGGDNGPLGGGQSGGGPQGDGPSELNAEAAAPKGVMVDA